MLSGIFLFHFVLLVFFCSASIKLRLEGMKWWNSKRVRNFKFVHLNSTRRTNQFRWWSSSNAHLHHFAYCFSCSMKKWNHFLRMKQFKFYNASSININAEWLLFRRTGDAVRHDIFSFEQKTTKFQNETWKKITKYFLYIATHCPIFSHLLCEHFISHLFERRKKLLSDCCSLTMITNCVRALCTKSFCVVRISHKTKCNNIKYAKFVRVIYIIFSFFSLCFLFSVFVSDVVMRGWC